MHRWIDHTGELQLSIEAGTEEAVFEDAVAAVGELLGRDEGGTPVRHEVEVTATDTPALLAEWIGELVFLAETESFVPERVSRLVLAGTSLWATVEGRQGDPPHAIKAVTYHNLTLEANNGTWYATVVLDV
jgi:SHS2 domain-containing protein